MGFPRQEDRIGLPFPPPGDPIACIGGEFSPLELLGKPIIPAELYKSMGLTPGATGGWGGGIGVCVCVCV